MAGRELGSCYGSEEDTEGRLWNANKLAVVIFIVIAIWCINTLYNNVLVLCVPSMV